ncbi:hypothetical protein J8J14_04045 [Roseomonas sp. SSH11]|uniref:Lipoprotein n=1 Tax=Pararoseomonas baculiformis TaxID=2820812 RepID=A0ABS4AAD5_9PROT|nr:hypothetical protein [Pararoseomonas baculiformis]MBP0443943.1 hypothetical protein [Pararoseomonas baculiformis]
MKSLTFALMPALLLAACANQAPAPAPVSGPQGARAALNAACTAEAERVVRYRDRGQLMRQDEYNARVGTTSHLGPQVISDQLAQVYERDRMAAECVRGANAAQPANAPAAAVQPDAVPAAATPAPSRRRGGATGR